LGYKKRQPLITPEIEPLIHGFMRSKAIGLGGTVFAIGGIEDHVHVVCSIPPKIAVATFIGQVKGASSAKVNQGRGDEEARFAWQEEYAVFSFDRKRLPYVVNYVEMQKQHHAEQSIIPILERTSGDQKGLLANEEQAPYLADYPQWLSEMAQQHPIPIIATPLALHALELRHYPTFVCILPHIRLPFR